MLKRIFVFLLAVLILAPLPAGAIKYKGDLESNESITFPEQSSKPASPAATKHKLYFKDDGAAYSLDSSGNENPLTVAGLKNKIINGDFDLWQRGATFNSIANNSYFADRWFHFDNGTTETINITRQAFTLGQTDVPGEPQYFVDFEIATKGDTTSIRPRQKIEGVRTFAGQTVIVSYYAKATTGFTARTDLIQKFGTGGSPSSGVNILGNNKSFTTTWQKFTQILSVLSISGKTLGTNNNDTLELVFIFDSVATGVTISVAQVQIEKGSVATGFEKRLIGLELMLAQRFYQKTFQWDQAPVQNVGNSIGALLAHADGTGRFDMPWPFATRMRASPTLTTYSPLSASADAWNLDDSTTTPITTVASPGERGISYLASPVDATDTNNRMVLHVTADAEL